MSLYGSENGLSKKVTKFYGSVEGVSKEVQKLYGSENGQSKLVYSAQGPSVDYIELTAAKPGSVNIFSVWTTPVIVYKNDSSPVTVDDEGKRISVVPGDVLRIYESTPNVTFRAWLGADTFVFGNTVDVTAMPSMNRFTTDDSGTIAGDHFFQGFAADRFVLSLPAGSFNTSAITTAQNNFFDYFLTDNTNITELPAGSFNFDNLRSVGNSAFSNFCSNDSSRSGSLTGLPDGSFGFGRLQTVGYDFCFSFASGNSSKRGLLSSLPRSSFNFSNLRTVGHRFCNYFNQYANLSYLPLNSFNTSGITSTGNDFMAGFNGGTTDTAGNLTRNTSSHTNTINKSSSLVRAVYKNDSSATQTNIAPGGNFNWNMGSS